METCDLAVIGGGLAGLSAAVWAARAGLSVVVCERHRELGGRGATEREGGFALNQGPHAIYRGGAALRALKELRVAFVGASPRAVGYAAHEGRLHTLPSGPASLLMTSLLPAAAKWELARVLGGLGRAQPARFRGQSAAQVVEGLAAHPAARSLLRASMRLATYCDDAEKNCGEAAMEQLKRSVTEGVVYVEGGWQTLADALAEAAQQAGATLRREASIEAVEPSAEGHLLRGPGVSLAARSVLVTAGPRVASKLLGARAASLSAFASEAAPLRAACLDVALSSVPRPEVRVILGIDRPVFGALQSETVRLAPPRGGVIHMMRYLREGEPSSSEHRAELEGFLEQMQPGWRSCAVRQRWLPSMIVTHARLEAARGGVRARPAVAVPELPGVFLAGDWVGSEGSLVDASFASARAAAAQIVEYTAEARGRAA